MGFLSGCILKPVWSYVNSSQAGCWAATTIVSELLKILGVLLRLSFDSTTHTPLNCASQFLFQTCVRNSGSHKKVYGGLILPLFFFCSQADLLIARSKTVYFSNSRSTTLIHEDREWGIEGVVLRGGRELFISHRCSCEQNGRVETDGERTQKQQNYNYLPWKSCLGCLEFTPSFRL